MGEEDGEVVGERVELEPDLVVPPKWPDARPNATPTDTASAARGFV
jgi:hypothetical protein